MNATTPHERDTSYSTIFEDPSTLLETKLEKTKLLVVVAGSAKNKTFMNTKQQRAHLIESNRSQTTFNIKNRTIFVISVKIQ